MAKKSRGFPSFLNRVNRPANWVEEQWQRAVLHAPGSGQLQLRQMKGDRHRHRLKTGSHRADPTPMLQPLLPRLAAMHLSDIFPVLSLLRAKLLHSNGLFTII